MSKNCHFDQLSKANFMDSYTVASGNRCPLVFKLNILLELVAMDNTDGCRVCSVEPSFDLVDSKHFLYMRSFHKADPPLRN
jgi:hypothetical protein